VSRTSAAVIAQRVEDIYGLVVDGQPFRIIRQFMTGNERAPGVGWEVDDRTLRRYVARATALIVERSQQSCDNIRDKHVERLERLYARNVQRGDLKAAFAVEQEIAKLHGLNAPTRAELTGANGEPLNPPVTRAELAARFDQLVNDQAKRIERTGELPTREEPHETAEQAG
jgi:hypothetical protein